MSNGSGSGGSERRGMHVRILGISVRHLHSILCHKTRDITFVASDVLHY